MPKKKTRKVVKGKNHAKIEKLLSLLAVFREKAQEHEDYINATCKATCEQITKYYNDRKKAIPDHVRKMTVTEIMEIQEQERKDSDAYITPDGNSNIRSVFEKNKLATEKKTQKKDKKRSLSASRPAPRIRDPSNMFPRLSRAVSETSILGKQPQVFVTPKFNPKLPVSRMARRPKADEVIMSLGGSPIKCYEDEVSLSLGQGKVIKFGEDVEMAENLSIDEPMLKILENVKNHLDKILKS